MAAYLRQVAADTGAIICHMDLHKINKVNVFVMGLIKVFRNFKAFEERLKRLLIDMDDTERQFIIFCSHRIANEQGKLVKINGIRNEPCKEVFDVWQLA